MLGRAGSTVPLVTSPAEDESEPELRPVGAEEQGGGALENRGPCHSVLCTGLRGWVWAGLCSHRMASGSSYILSEP